MCLWKAALRTATCVCSFSSTLGGMSMESFRWKGAVDNVSRSRESKRGGFSLGLARTRGEQS